MGLRHLAPVADTNAMTPPLPLLRVLGVPALHGPDDRVFWEVLPHAVAIPEKIGDCELTFLVEPTTKGFVHACTVQDVGAVEVFAELIRS